MISIRPATLADLEKLAELAAATFPDACPPELAPANIEAFIAKNLSQAAFENYLSDPRYIVRVAVNGREPVGYSLLDCNSPAPAQVPEPAGYISKLYLARVARGTGAATLLMDAALADIRARGLVAAHLGTNIENKRSNAFYAKSGFEVVGTRQFEVGGQACTDNIWARIF